MCLMGCGDYHAQIIVRWNECIMNVKHLGWRDWMNLLSLIRWGVVKIICKIL